MQPPKCGVVRSQLVAVAPHASVNGKYPCTIALLYSAGDACFSWSAVNVAAIGARSLMGADSGFDDSEETRALKRRLEELREKHRALDESIRELQEGMIVDALQVARLKKEKLALKDQIVWIEDQLMPDIIA